VNLTQDLVALKERIEEIARGYGLDFFETFFELVDYDEMNEIASYGGFPTRYPHWRFGMHYEELDKGYSYGLQKIYELVINNDPCYAYLMGCNAPVDQKMVIAHVLGHSDFFKNNLWFSKTNRKMVDQMANHGVRIRKHIEKVGLEEVEGFVDVCLSLENLVDVHSPFITRRSPARTEEEVEDEARRIEAPRIRSKEYMERYINPPEYLEQVKQKLLEEARRRKRTFPEHPERDVLQFLLEHAPLEKWERDVLSIVRDEAYYFAPQAMTKIMNEGWATYWHSKMLTERCLADTELIDYADHHSATLGTQPGRVNPYKLGVELFRDIEDRWNRGRFGREFDSCDDLDARRNWDRHLNQGRAKLFEVRKVMNDLTFLDTFLTEEFCERHKLFVYQWNPRTNRHEIASRDFRQVKEGLLRSLTNLGHPAIAVLDANHKNRGELYLAHSWDGQDLKYDEATETLKHLFRIWQRPVHLETKEEGRGKLISYDGDKVGTQEILPSA
jgi:stage V sporulation protein R